MLGTLFKNLCLLRALKGRMRAILRSTDSQQIQNRHTNCYSVRDLFENAGLRTIGHFRRDFDSSIHRTWMQHDGVWFSNLQTLGVQLIAENVVIRRNGGLIESLSLYAKHYDYVRALQGFFDAMNASNRRAGSNPFELSRNPHRRPAKSESAAKFPQQMNIGARDPAMLQIAENRNV